MQPLSNNKTKALLVRMELFQLPPARNLDLLCPEKMSLSQLIVVFTKSYKTTAENTNIVQNSDNFKISLILQIENFIIIVFGKE